ncbi:hypothetical protein DL89DRAFT_48373 [Linderina pennispora]|uniref:Uncharacterized protein n=1 Tax=Linderina pennispora TaxID=61395 RepID=A0A1Y1W285_9FUNG|nr:uncharacterized protein DL89DRAFT_48373 [Linderina pennispora]ORX67650.1 hypothetical protein DL89DRAFT_48373 [Linderina pennispora]
MTPIRKLVAHLALNQKRFFYSDSRRIFRYLRSVDYHADVHALKTTGGRMNKVTLPSIPWIRTMDNDVVGDILYYFSTYHGRAMLRIVTEKLNAAYDAFMEQHPYFNGPISLVAHSLGGMICYEILYYQKLRSLAHKQHCKISQLARVEHERYVELPKLKFTPTRLFTMGSPHGGTFVFRHLDFDSIQYCAHWVPQYLPPV